MDYDFRQLEVLIEGAKALKESASNSDTARHWAVLRTELEKVNGYYQTYLAGSGDMVVGGSE